MTDIPPADQNQDDPAGLRKKLDAALDSNRKLTVENTLLNAGLGHLNDAQRHALTVTLPKGTEINAEVLKTQAGTLGFPTEPAAATPPPATPPATPPGDPAVPPADPNAVPPTYDPGTQWLAPGTPTSAHPDPRVSAAISGLTAQEEAHVQALRAQSGGAVGGNLDEALSKANSKAEAIAAIRQHGPSAGIMLDSDLV